MSRLSKSIHLITSLEYNVGSCEFCSLCDQLRVISFKEGNGTLLIIEQIIAKIIKSHYGEQHETAQSNLRRSARNTNRTEMPKINEDHPNITDKKETKNNKFNQKPSMTSADSIHQLIIENNRKRKDFSKGIKISLGRNSHIRRRESAYNNTQTPIPDDARNATFDKNIKIEESSIKGRERAQSATTENSRNTRKFHMAMRNSNFDQKKLDKPQNLETLLSNRAGGDKNEEETLEEEISHLKEENIVIESTTPQPPPEPSLGMSIGHPPRLNKVQMDEGEVIKNQIIAKIQSMKQQRENELFKLSNFFNADAKKYIQDLIDYKPWIPIPFLAKLTLERIQKNYPIEPVIYLESLDNSKLQKLLNEISIVMKAKQWITELGNSRNPLKLDRNLDELEREIRYLNKGRELYLKILRDSTHFKRLGLSYQSSEKEIKSAYKKLVNDLA